MPPPHGPSPLPPLSVSADPPHPIPPNSTKSCNQTHPRSVTQTSLRTGGLPGSDTSVLFALVGAPSTPRLGYSVFVKAKTHERVCQRWDITGKREDACLPMRVYSSNASSSWC